MGRVSTDMKMVCFIIGCFETIYDLFMLFTTIETVFGIMPICQLRQSTVPSDDNILIDENHPSAGLSIHVEEGSVCFY